MKLWYIYIFLGISILLGAFGQIFMKIMMNHLGPFPLQDKSKWLFYAFSILTSKYLWYVFLCYGISIVLWLMVLSYADLSLVRPLMSLGYLITLAYGIYSGESVTNERIIGTFLIIGGVFFLTKH
ncbi:MAG: transporter [Leptospiraceae bacterium]|nr:MAG: transporter [Leptospiraceae bacterium]